MSSSLRDELASLKIDRRGKVSAPSRKSRPGRRLEGPGIGLRLLSLLIWLIPLSLVGVGATYAYKQYKEIQSKPEVKVGRVQMMTSGEADKILSAKGYLRARYQADICTKVSGRVQELLVEEGSKVKKGQLLVVLEHNDLDAQLESRKALMLRAKSDIEEAKADLEYKTSKADRAKRLINRKHVGLDRGDATIDLGRRHGRGPPRGPRSHLQAPGVAGPRGPGLGGQHENPGAFRRYRDRASRRSGRASHRQQAPVAGGPQPDGRRNRHRREPALEDRHRPARRDLGQRRA